MWNWVRITALGILALCSAIAATWARDAAYEIQALIVMVAALGLFVWEVRHMEGLRAPAPPEFNEGVIRAGVIATCAWALVGFAVGLFIALQLAFPQLNFEFLHGLGNFGRLRPLHTSAVIFAFCGNALIATSFYVVQRTTQTRLFGRHLAWCVFWGYQLFIVLAAVGYIFGANQTKEYAEPEWIADWWLSLVWIAYIITYLGTIMRRKVAQIHVANWFYLAFILTIALLHMVNNLSVPVSFFGSKSVPLFGGLQDAMTQWWYGHNAVGFLLTAAFLGMMYYFVPLQAGRALYSTKLAMLHFWALIFMYIWTGPNHLSSEALPQWISTLGLAFAILLWLPSWGGLLTVALTLKGAKLRQDPVLRMMVLALAFYALATLEAPVMSLRAANAISHYSEWTIGQVHAGALGWNGMLTFAALYALVPRLWRRSALYSNTLVTWHLWLAGIGIVVYAAAMAVAGSIEGAMWEAVDASGQPINDFAQTVAAKFPMYVLRAVGGGLYLSGAILMCYNLWMTTKGKGAALPVRPSAPTV